jgi:hypothetical protein
VLLASVMVASCFSMGCFITRDPSYEPPPDIPPSVVTILPETTPMNRVYRLRTAPEGEDAGVRASLTFVATVREMNQGQNLEGVVYVDRGFVGGHFANFLRRIPPNTEAENPLERRVSFDIADDQVSPGCHVVELLVSSEFDDVNAPHTTNGDLGVGAWWVYRSDTNSVDMSTCPGPGTTP